MIQPIKSDDPLMKNIPDTVTRFEYENMVIEILHQEKKEFDLILIIKETPDIHYHIYQEKGEIYFHKTFHSKDGRERHESIDIEKSLKKLGEIMLEVFSKAEKIDLNDNRFIGRMVYFITHNEMNVEIKTKKKVIFGQEVQVDEVIFEEINKNFHKLGIIIDDNESEEEMIFINDGDIFRLNLELLNQYENSNILG